MTIEEFLSDGGQYNQRTVRIETTHFFENGKHQKRVKITAAGYVNACGKPDGPRKSFCFGVARGESALEAKVNAIKIALEKIEYPE